jgi:hypothetical protein
MAELTDIREWARREGRDIGERGRVPKDVIADYEAAQINARADLNGEPDVALPDDPDTGETPPAPPDPGRSRSGAPRSDETRPAPGKRKRFWQPKDPPAGGKPKPAPKRLPLETWAGRLWKGLAYVAGAGNTPTSRCLNMQAPVAGIILDDMIKGTAIDRLAQPLARMGEGGKNVAALVGLPLLVAATERQPQLYPYTRPLMAEAATEWVLIAGPAMRKAKQRAEAVAKELAEFEFDPESVAGMFDRPAENPAIVAMLDAIFLPMFGVQREPEPAAA